jgi:hypothetical protein
VRVVGPSLDAESPSHLGGLPVPVPEQLVCVQIQPQCERDKIPLRLKIVMPECIREQAWLSELGGWLSPVPYREFKYSEDDIA